MVEQPGRIYSVQDTDSIFRLSRETDHDQLLDLWSKQPANFPAALSVTVQPFAKHEIQPTPEASALLAATTKLIAERNGLKTFTAFAQPDGAPWLPALEIRLIHWL